MAKSVLLISHQLDYTGAPLALLDLARALTSLGHETHLAALKDGPLKDEFLRQGVCLAKPTGQHYDFCLANTVVASKALPHLRKDATTLAAWIHESPLACHDHPHLCYNQIPDCLDYILGVADFQIEALQPYRHAAKLIRFDNTVDIGHLSKSNIQQAQYATERAVRVCIIGVNTKRKGLYKLAQLAHLGPPRSPLIITLIGDGTEKIADLIRRQRINNVTAVSTGEISRKEVFSQLRQSDIYLTLSEDEVKPLSILEAIAIGIPVIASEIPAHAELANEFAGVQCSKHPVQAVWEIANGRGSALPQRHRETDHHFDRYRWKAFLSRTTELLNRPE